jgi:hypothetical protein
MRRAAKLDGIPACVGFTASATRIGSRKTSRRAASHRRGESGVTPALAPDLLIVLDNQQMTVLCWPAGDDTLVIARFHS